LLFSASFFPRSFLVDRICPLKFVLGYFGFSSSPQITNRYIPLSYSIVKPALYSNNLTSVNFQFPTAESHLPQVVYYNSPLEDFENPPTLSYTILQDLQVQAKVKKSLALLKLLIIVFSLPFSFSSFSFLYSSQISSSFLATNQSTHFPALNYPRKTLEVF